jgi:hypothetical protein
MSQSIALAQAQQRVRVARANLLSRKTSAELAQRDGRWGAATEHRKHALRYQQELEEAERLLRQLQSPPSL